MTTQREEFDHLALRLATQQRLPSPSERRRLREKHGLSLRAAAAGVGVSATAIAAWESGRYKPTAAHLPAYLDLLTLLRDLEARDA